jgi:hypothetical protein
MSNGGNLLSIPSDQGVERVILNTNVTVGNSVVHVQTEEVKFKKLIVTYVLYEGQVIDRVERGYTAHEGKPNLRELIAKVADAQHSKKIREVPTIWDGFSKNIKISIKPPKRTTLRPVPMPVPVAPQLDTARALELFELGLTLYKEEPLRAQGAWEEAVRLDPDNKVYRANLKKLRDMAHGVLINDKKSGCFSACFKPSTTLRLVKAG